MTVYLTLRDRPASRPGLTPEADARAASVVRRHRVAPVVVTLGLVSLLTDISSESVSAILPIYLTGVLGLSTVAYGFVDGIQQGGSALVRIAAGWAADSGGHPKWVALVGYGLSSLARVGFLFATGLGAIAAVVTADRIGKGIRTAPRDAMIADATPEAHLGQAFGVHRTLDTIGAALGPLIAFALLWWIPDGYGVVLAVSLGCAVLGVALLGLMVSEPATRRDRATTPPFRWRDLTDRRLRRLLVAAGLLGLLTVGDGFLYLALLDRGQFAVHWFPLLYVGTNVAYLALAVPLGRLADRVGRVRVLLLGHVALVGAYACAVAPLPDVAGTLLALLLLGCFYAGTDGVLAALGARLVPASARASGIASVQTVVALARLVSSSLFGVLWLLAGPTAALALVGGLLLLALVPVFRGVAGLDRPAVTS